MAGKKLEALRAHNDMFRKEVIEVRPALDSCEFVTVDNSRERT